MHLVTGASIVSQAAGRMNGAFRFPETGGSRLKKEDSYIDRLNLEDYQ